MASADAARISAGIAEAASLREQGNELWRQGAVNDAMVKYHHCLNHLNGLDRHRALAGAVGVFAGGGSAETPLTEEQNAQWREVYVAANLNLAAGLLRKEKWARCVEVCNTALSQEPTSVKALLRRAKALLHLREADKARSDLDAMQAHSPGDADAAALRKELAALDAQLAAQEAAVWRQAFAKSSLGA